MASLAVVKVGFAEGALIVVAGHAALRARVWEMLRREGRADLTALRQTSPADVVATIAVEILARAVIRVAEAEAERARLCRCPRVATRPVTGAAGGNINSAGLPARSVTLIAGLVRSESGGNCLGDATPRRSRTGHAPLALCFR